MDDFHVDRYKAGWDALQSHELSDIAAGGWMFVDGFGVQRLREFEVVKHDGANSNSVEWVLEPGFRQYVTHRWFEENAPDELSND